MPSNTYKSDVTDLVTTYHTVKKMTDSTSSMMMGSFGVGDALTASSPPLRPIAVTNPPPAPPVHPPMVCCFTYLA